MEKSIINNQFNYYVVNIIIAGKCCFRYTNMERKGRRTVENA